MQDNTYMPGEDPAFDEVVEQGARAFEEFTGGGTITDFDRVLAELAAERRREQATGRFTKQARDAKEQKRHEKAVSKRRKAKRGGPR